MKNEKSATFLNIESGGRLGKIRVVLYMILDILLLNFSVFFSLWVRSIDESRILGEYLNSYFAYITFYTLTVIAAELLFDFDDDGFLRYGWDSGYFESNCAFTASKKA